MCVLTSNATYVVWISITMTWKCDFAWSLIELTMVCLPSIGSCCADWNKQHKGRSYFKVIYNVVCLFVVLLTSHIPT